MTEHSQEFLVAGAPQQDFVITGTYTPGAGNTNVTLNGQDRYIATGDYIELNVTTIRMAAPVPIGQIVKVTWYV